MQKIKKTISIVTITAILLSGISVFLPKITSAAVPISTSLSTVSSSPSSVPANGTNFSTITVNIKNTTGGAYAGVTVVVASSRGTITDSIETISATTNSLGNATFKIKSISAGTATIAARVGTITITDTATVTFTAVALIRMVSPTLSSVNADDSSVPANGTDYATITVNVKDATGFYFSGRTVLLSYSGTTSVSTETVNDETDVAGNAIFRVKSSSAGSATFTARVGTTTITDSTSVTFTVPITRVVSPVFSSVTASTSSVSANGTDYATIFVYVGDLTNTVFPGQTVILSSSRGASDTIETVIGTTDTSGLASFRVRSAIGGISTYTARASGTTITDTATVTFTIVIAPSVSASQSIINASPTSVAVGGTSDITVEANDSSGGDVEISSKSLSSSRGGADTISVIFNGRHSAIYRVSSSTPGTATFTATVNGVVLTDTATVRFIGPISASQSIINASPTSVAVGGTSDITVEANDSSGGDVEISSKSLSSSRGGADTISVIFNGRHSAIYRVSSSTPGTATFTATVNGVVLTHTVDVTFVGPVVPAEDPAGAGSSGSGSSGTSDTDPSDTPASIVLNFGDLFKENGSTAVYYYANNGKRYVFPTQAIYFSWYINFADIKTVTRAQITAIPLGGNILARPGRHLVQFVSMDTPFRVMDPRVYVLAQNGQLRWLKNTEVAVSLYGSNWEQKIIAVPEIYKINYGNGLTGADVENVSGYSRSSIETMADSIDNVIAR